MLKTSQKIVTRLYCVLVKIVSFSLFRSRHGQNRQFQHVWIMSWSKLSVSACLERVMVKIVSLSMFGLCHGQNRQFQHVWIMSCSKSSIAAFRVMVKIIRFKIAGMFHS
jgi:hypothetical protein